MKQHQLPQTPNTVDTARVTEVFKALSEPIRLNIVLLLSHGDTNVSELVVALDLPQSTVSRHLAILRAARLVKVQRQGNSNVYRLADTHLRALLLEAFSHAEHERLQLVDHPEKKETKVPA